MIPRGHIELDRRHGPRGHVELQRVQIVDGYREPCLLARPVFENEGDFRLSDGRKPLHELSRPGEETAVKPVRRLTGDTKVHERRNKCIPRDRYPCALASAHLFEFDSFKLVLAFVPVFFDIEVFHPFDGEAMKTGRQIGGRNLHSEGLSPASLWLIPQLGSVPGTSEMESPRRTHRRELGPEHVRCHSLNPHQQRSGLAKRHAAFVPIPPVTIREDVDAFIDDEPAVERTEIMAGPWFTAGEKENTRQRHHDRSSYPEDSSAGPTLDDIRAPRQTPTGCATAPEVFHRT